MASAKYDEFLKKMEIIYIYYEFYGFSSNRIAYITNSNEEMTQCYCEYLLQSASMKRHIELNIVDISEVENGGNIVEQEKHVFR